jgi:formate hydrogenlyase transcriptional activator
MLDLIRTSSSAIEAKEKEVISSAALDAPASGWLLENGPRELEMLFRAVIYRTSAPLLITDDERASRDASVGAAKLLGLPRDAIIGQTLDDFAAPNLKPVIPERWETFLNQDEQEGVLQLLDQHGTLKEVEYAGKKNVLPVRHPLVLRDKRTPAEPVSSWVCDYALFLIITEERIAAWYEGARRI